MSGRWRALTLIELLVVIAIIAIPVEERPISYIYNGMMSFLGQPFSER